MFLGTQYSDWIPVPAEKSTPIYEIKEGKKFQLRTDKKIDGSNDIRWAILGANSYFQFTTGSLGGTYCGAGIRFTNSDRDSMGFFQRAGVLTVLKSSTQLQIWFDDVLEVTWVYEDNSAGTCSMRNPMTGLQFRLQNYEDKVSTHYRYQIGGTLKQN